MASTVGAIMGVDVVAAARAATTPPIQLVEVVPVAEERGAPERAPATFAGRLAASPGAPDAMGLAGEVEPNNTPATATPLPGTDTVVRADVLPVGDIDYFSFSANAGDRVYAATMSAFSGSGSSDTQLRLFASDGTTLIEFDDDDGTFGASSSSIAGATIPASGTYYLAVRHGTPATGLLFPYELHLRVQSGAPAPEVEPNNTPATATPLPPGGWVGGARDPAGALGTGDADYFSLALAAGDTVFLSLDLDPERDGTTWNGRVGFGLFGDANNIVILANDPGTGDAIPSEAMFFTVRSAGTYVVYVDSSEAAAGGPTATYHLGVSVRPATSEGLECTTYTSTDVPRAIGPDPGLVSSTIVVPGNPVVADLDVSIQLTHALMADVDVQLRSPVDNDNAIFNDIGAGTSGGQAQMDLVFDDEAAIPPGSTTVRSYRAKPESAYRLSWFDGIGAGGTWTLDVRDDAVGNGGTLTGWSLRICEAPPPPSCAHGFVRTTVYGTDFESGDGGFTSSGANNSWARGTPNSPATTATAPLAGFTTCASGTNCFKTNLGGPYPANSVNDLRSPTIDLTGLSPPVLVEWSHRYQMEGTLFDRYSVDLQEVGGANPVRLFEWRGATMTNAVGSPATNIGASAGWARVVARADALAGQDAELRLLVQSDASGDYQGAAIDDVTVSACRAIAADLGITKTDGSTTAVPGTSVTYTITAGNPTGDPVASATVTDIFPATLTGCTWTCTGSGGGTCTAAGSGNVNDTVGLPTGASVTYTATCTITASAAGTLSNTATITSSTPDPTPENNSATDTNTLTPRADLSIAKTNGVTSVTPGSSTTYTIAVGNAGPSAAPGTTVTDNFPAACTSVTWTCAGSGGASCGAANGSGNISQTVNMPVGGSLEYSATCAVSASATGTLSNTATVAAGPGVTDPGPENNSATDADALLSIEADLSVAKTVTGGPVFLPGDLVEFRIVASNAGPGAATGATVADSFPAACSSVTWTCSGTAGGTCPASGAGNIAAPVNLPVGASVTFVARCQSDRAFIGNLVNTATITPPPGVVDPTPGNATSTATASFATRPVPVFDPRGVLLLLFGVMALAGRQLRQR